MFDQLLHRYNFILFRNKENMVDIPNSDLLLLVSVVSHHKILIQSSQPVLPNIYLSLTYKNRFYLLPNLQVQNHPLVILE